MINTIKLHRVISRQDFMPYDVKSFFALSAVGFPDHVSIMVCSQYGD